MSVNLARSEQFWPRITWDCKQRMGSLSDNKTCHLRPTKSGRINNPFRGPRGDISPTIIGNWVLQGQPLLTEHLQLLRVWPPQILGWKIPKSVQATRWGQWCLSVYNHHEIHIYRYSPLINQNSPKRAPPRRDLPPWISKLTSTTDSDFPLKWPSDDLTWL